MPKSSRQRIVIVGAGASGALMAAHLMRRRPANLDITLVESGPEIGRGLARTRQGLPGQKRRRRAMGQMMDARSQLR